MLLDSEQLRQMVSLHLMATVLSGWLDWRHLQLPVEQTHLLLLFCVVAFLLDLFVTLSAFAPEHHLRC